MIFSWFLIFFFSALADYIFNSFVGGFLVFLPVNIRKRLEKCLAALPPRLFSRVTAEIYLEPANNNKRVVRVCPSCPVDRVPRTIARERTVKSKNRAGYDDKHFFFSPSVYGRNTRVF